MGESPHMLHALATDSGGEQWPEAVPPEPDRLVADLDPALSQEILHIPERQQVLHVHRGG